MRCTLVPPFIRRVAWAWRLLWLALVAGCWPGQAAALNWDAVPETVRAALLAGQPADVVLEYDMSEVDAEVRQARQARPAGERFEPPALLALRAQRYASLKQPIDAALARAGVVALHDYSHLPMAARRLTSAAALRAVLAQARVRAVYPDRPLHRVGTPNLDLVAQPAVAAVGYTGAGSTVAVIDDGIDLSNSAFGNCTAPGVPAATCAVVAVVSYGTGSSSNLHGTNVSAIAVGVAPAAKVAMVNVFSGTTASTSAVIKGINWAISNRATYGITAINMSLGDGSNNTSPCASGNPYVTPVNSARNAGITVVAAAGNEAYTQGLGSPACTPGVVSVGAVYADNYNGGYTWGNNLCTDYSTAADQIACFSDSASFMTLWAPGAMVTAGGITEGGTSQASPHVAGAVAVLRSAFAADTLATTLARLTTSRTWLTDARNGVSRPRLDLAAAAAPANDLFAAATVLSGDSGTAAGTNRLATLDSGESVQPATAGGKTVWWRWTASASGQVSLSTQGSTFDTTLAVYTGSSPSALTLLASNDNASQGVVTSALLFQATAGTTYRWAVDGAAGAQGGVNLAWALNTAAQANLSLSGPTPPPSPSVGSVTRLGWDVANAGPQTATRVALVFTLPAGVSWQASSSPCVLNGSQLACAVGDVSAGTSAHLDLDLLWQAAGPATVQASVQSDLPDASATDNSVQLAATVLPAEDVDAPTLPQWAALVLGGLLMLQLVQPWPRVGA